jgi:hypothetical protein
MMVLRNRKDGIVNLNEETESLFERRFLVFQPLHVDEEFFLLC